MCIGKEIPSYGSLKLYFLTKQFTYNDMNSWIVILGQGHVNKSKSLDIFAHEKIKFYDKLLIVHCYFCGYN